MLTRQEQGFWSPGSGEKMLLSILPLYSSGRDAARAAAVPPLILADAMPLELPTVSDGIALQLL